MCGGVVKRKKILPFEINGDVANLRPATAKYRHSDKFSNIRHGAALANILWVSVRGCFVHITGSIGSMAHKTKQNKKPTTTKTRARIIVPPAPTQYIAKQPYPLPSDSGLTGEFMLTFFFLSRCYRSDPFPSKEDVRTNWKSICSHIGNEGEHSCGA